MNGMVLIRVARRCGLVAALIATGAHGALGQEPRPATYVRDGACPGEGCTYGPARLAVDVKLLSAPAETASVVGLVHRGDSVLTLTGRTQTTPTPYVLGSAREGLAGRKYAVGDTVWLLDYLGEGQFRVWFKGSIFQEEFGFGPWDQDQADQFGRLVRPYRSEWWIKMRTRAGLTGWVRFKPDMWAE